MTDPQILWDGTNTPSIGLYLLDIIPPTAGISVPTNAIREVSIRRGRAREDQRYDVGTMTLVLDNFTGDFDPDNTSSDYASYLRAGTFVDFFVTWDGSDYDRFVGYIESVSMDIGFQPTTTITFVDGMAALQGATTQDDPRWGQLVEGPDATTGEMSYDGETTNSRVTRVVAFGPSIWVSGNVISSAAQVTLNPFKQNTTLMDVMHQCADAEAGRWFVNRSGGLQFECLADRFDGTLHPLVVDFADDRLPDTVEYDEITVNTGSLTWYNTVTVNCSDIQGANSSVTVAYNPSIADYGRRQRSIDTAMDNIVMAQQLAGYWARKNALPVTYVERISFTPIGYPSLWPNICRADLGDYCTVVRNTVDGRSMGYECVIEGIEEHYTPTEWRVTYNTSAASDVSADIVGALAE